MFAVDPSSCRSNDDLRLSSVLLLSPCFKTLISNSLHVSNWHLSLDLYDPVGEADGHVLYVLIRYNEVMKMGLGTLLEELDNLDMSTSNPVLYRNFQTTSASTVEDHRI